MNCYVTNLITFKLSLKKEYVQNRLLGIAPSINNSKKNWKQPSYKYIINNLSKRFIKSNNTFYTSLILIVQKLDKGLYFYIDYQKLNLIIQKD